MSTWQDGQLVTVVAAPAKPHRHYWKRDYSFPVESVNPPIYAWACVGCDEIRSSPIDPNKADLEGFVTALAHMLRQQPISDGLLLRECEAYRLHKRPWKAAHARRYGR